MKNSANPKHSKELLNLSIHDAILHWVPLNVNDKQPKFSEKTAMQINENFWLKKISDSLNKHYTREVKEIAEQPGHVTQNIRLMATATTDDFITRSITVATLLHNLQKGNVSEGFLIFFRGDFENKKFICLLKLEGMEGSEADFNNSRKSYEIRPLESILLTNKSKVFKMAFFVMSQGHLKRIHIMDDQVNRNEISDFWLTKFLGCQHIQTPERLTREFYDFINGFSNIKRLSPKESRDIKIGLIAELNSQSKTISLSKFAKKYVPAEMLPLFNSKVKNTNLPLRDFEKVIDPPLVKQLSVRKFILEHEIAIQIPEAALAYENKIRIDKIDNGEYQIVLKAKILKDVT